MSTFYVRLVEGADIKAFTAYVKELVQEFAPGSDDPDVNDVIKFLREREIVHFQRFGDAMRVVQDKLDGKNFYAFNPAFDRQNKK